MGSAEERTSQRPRLNEPLEALTSARGVLGCVLATGDGFPVAARLQSGQDREGLSAAAAAMGEMASRTLGRLGMGGLAVAGFQASRFTLLVRRVSVGYLLVVAEPEGNVGFIAAEMNRVAAALEEAAASLAEG